MEAKSGRKAAGLHSEVAGLPTGRVMGKLCQKYNCLTVAGPRPFLNPESIQMWRAWVSRNRPSSGLSSASLFVLAAMLMPQAARAASECGPDGAGADTVTCTSASYPNGITYTGSDGVDLVLSNPAMTVAKGTSTGGINVTGTTTNDLTLTATSLTSVDGGTGTAVTVNNGGDGKAAVTLDAGSFTSTAAQTVFAIHASGAGDSIITNNGGAVANTFLSGIVYTLDAEVNGTGTGNATVLMTGGTVQTSGVNNSAGLRAGIANATSSATASVTLSGGSTAGVGIGALATTNGSGLAQVTVNGGSITTGTGVTGTGGSFGAEALNTGSGNAVATLTTGSITSGNVFTASGVFANANSGTATASMTNGTITAKGSAGAGIYAVSTAGAATASMSGGSVTNTASNGYGLHAAIGGGTSTGTATVLLSGGTVSTSGTSAFGLYSQATNGQALLQITNGSVTTSALNAIGATANATGPGSATVQISGGSVTTGGGSAAGLRSLTVDGLATLQMTGGTVTANGPNSPGILASATGAGSYSISVTGGTVKGGGTIASAIRAIASTGGTIAIGSAATINGAASGVAVDTSLGTGPAAITTAGTLTGAINLAAAANTLSITGGSIAGNISGGGSTAISFDPGAGNSFTYGAAYTIGGASSLAMNSGTVQVDGTITAGALTVNAGTMTLTGANSFAGGTTLNGGVLSVSGDANLGAASGGLTFNGGTLQVTGTAFNSTPRTINWGAGGGAFDIAGASNSFTVSQTLASGGALTKLGAGTLVLTGTNGYSGGTILNAGTLQVAADANLGAASGTLTFNGGTLTNTVSFASARTTSLIGAGTFSTNSGTTLTMNGAVSGIGALTKTGAGTLILAADNGYTGLTTISAGTLQVGNGAATGSITGDVANNGTLTFNRTGTLTYAGAITGTGPVNLTGGAAYTFTGHNSYSGNTAITASTLLLDSGGSITTTGTTTLGGANVGVTVSGTGSALTTGTLVVGTNTTDTVTLNIDNGGVVRTTVAAATVIGTSSFVHTATVNVMGAGSLLDLAGSLSVGTINPGVSSLVNVAGGGTLRSNGGTIGAAFGATVPKTVTVADAGSNWVNSGTLNIVNGSLSVLNGGTATATSGTMGSGAASALTVSGAGSDLSLTGALTTSGAAAATITLADSGRLGVGGGITLANSGISAAVLNIGGGEGQAAAAAGALDTPTLAFGPGTGRLNFDHTSTGYDFATLVSGTGTINQVAGVTKLSGNSATFAGTTAVSGGTLLVNGALGNATSTVNVATGGIFGGTGTIGGNVNVADGTLAAGSGGVGTLTINGNLSLGVSSNLNFELGQANTVGGSLNDLVTVGGNLTLDGTLNVGISPGGTFGPGTYRLFNYGGTLTDNGLSLGAVPGGSTLTVQTSTPGQVNLLNSGGLTLNLWDGTGPKFNNVVNGGSGTWQNGTGNDNWTTPAGDVNAPYADGAFAIFSGTAGTVTVDNSLGQVSASGMQFATNGYVVTGGSVALTGSNAIIRVGDGTAGSASYTATINSVLSGTSALEKTDFGTLILTGTNSYSGGTVLTGGTLQISSDANLGGAGGLTFNGGTLHTTADITSARAVAFTAAGTIQTDAGTTLSLGGAISGPGSLAKAGAGTLILTGADSHSGGSTISAGTLQVGAGGTSGSITGDVVDNGALAFNRSDSITFTGLVSGTGGLNQIGSGTTVLTGGNSYAGATNVAAGTLLVNGDQTAATGLTSAASGTTIGGTGIIGGNLTVANGATLAPGSGNAGTLAVDGNLSLGASSTLAYEFGQSNTVGGPLNDLTTVHGNLTLDGSINVTVTPGGSFDPGFYRVIGYDGTLTDNGLSVGTMPVTSSDVTVQTSVAHQVNLVNTHGVTLNVWDGASGPHGDGVVQGGNGVWQNNTGNSNWTDGTGAFTAAYSDGSFAVFTGAAGTVTVDNSLGAVNSAGMQFAVDGYSVGGNALTLTGAQATIRVGDGTAAGAAYTATLNNVLAGNAELVKSDLGTLTLGGANTYTGGTLLKAGTLRINSDGNLGAAAGSVDFNGGMLGIGTSLTSARAVTLTGAGTIATDGGTTASLSGVVSGAGPLTKSGAGTLALNGTNIYGGATTVAAGTLLINGNQSAAHGLITVQSGAMLGGSGTIGGDVSILGGATLAPGGASAATLAINGNLTLGATATLNYRFGQAGTAGGALNDLVTVGGNLTLDGTINVTAMPGGTFGPGLYRLFDYAGTLTDNGLALGSVPNAGNVSVQTSVTGQVNLVYASPPPPPPPGGGQTYSFWDGQAGPKADGLIQGGNGTWQLGGSANNWTDTAGAANGSYAQGTFAIFTGAGGNVTIDNGNGGVQASGLQFAADGYRIGGGTLTLTGSNATVRVGDGSSAGAGFTATIDAPIAGSAGLTKTDAGTLILTGTNSYTGATNVAGGALIVNGDQSGATGAATVQSGASLGGTGKIGGSVSIADGATLSPGYGGPGMLTIGGDLSLGATSTTKFELGKANVVGGSLNDLVEVGGNLTLGGTLQVSQSAGGSFDPGIYRLFDYGGTLTNNAPTLAGLAGGTGVLLDTSTAHQVNLINTSGFTLNYWDAAGANNNAVNGGNGTWQAAADANWTNATGQVNAPYANAAFAVFEGTEGTVTIDNGRAPVRASGMQFAVDGYTITGGTLTLVGNQSVIRVGDGTAAGAAFKATISAPIAGDTQLVKADAGTLILSGANLYTGGTAVTGGTLQIASDANLGAASGNVSLDGATLHTTADMTSARALALDGDGTVNVDGSTKLSWNGLVSGPGNFAKAGGGNLVLTADSSAYAGTTSLSAGTLQVDGALGGNVQVQQDARLQGNGRVGAVVNNAGAVIAPGDSIGHLTIAGDYVGAGGSLEIEAQLGGDASPADLLTVQGSTSGTTSVKVLNRGGLGAQTVNGIKIIDVAGASNGTFALQGDYVFQGAPAVIAGAYGYRLYKGGVATPSDGDWYLRSALLNATSPPQTPDIPLYQPGVPVYEVYPSTLLLLNGVDTMQQRVGDRGYSTSEDGHLNGIWGRMQGQRFRPNAATTTTMADADYNSWSAEIGADRVLLDAKGGTLTGGVSVRYGKANAQVTSLFGNGKIRTHGLGGRATLTWQDKAGFYADAQAQFSWYDSDLTSATLGKLARGNDGTGQTYSLELGRRVGLGGGIAITPQLQTVYSKVRFDRFTDPAGADVSLGKADSLKTRWGIAIEHANGAARVYAIGNLTYDWLGDTVTDVSGTPIARSDHRLWGELGLGGNVGVSDRLTLYGEATANSAINNFGKSYGLKAMAGLRMKF